MRAAEQALIEFEIAVETFRVEVENFSRLHHQRLGPMYARLDELDAQIAEAGAARTGDPEDLRKAQEARALVHADARGRGAVPRLDGLGGAVPRGRGDAHRAAGAAAAAGAAQRGGPQALPRPGPQGPPGPGAGRGGAGAARASSSPGSTPRTRPGDEAAAAGAGRGVGGRAGAGRARPEPRARSCTPGWSGSPSARSCWPLAAKELEESAIGAMLRMAPEDPDRLLDEIAEQLLAQVAEREAELAELAR